MEKQIKIYQIFNGNFRITFTNVGASILQLFVRDKEGKYRDVVLAHKSLEDYCNNFGSLGATIGRYADRILGGSIEVGGKTYDLIKNDGGKHTIHGGGKAGFSHKIWEVEKSFADSITFVLHSPHLDAGFPGNLTVRLTYRVEGKSFFIEYEATSDADTYVSLTNHAYFNLNGHDAGDVLGHTLQLTSDAFLPCDPEQILTGEIRPVEGTPNDFRCEKTIGQDLNVPFDQFDYAGGGYDTAFCLQETGDLHPCAKVRGEKSGITMQVDTTYPLVLFYTANHMDGTKTYKDGALYDKYAGFCLETQMYVDAMHFDNFPDSMLKKGELYSHKTCFTFDVE